MSSSAKPAFTVSDPLSITIGRGGSDMLVDRIKSYKGVIDPIDFSVYQ